MANKEFIARNGLIVGSNVFVVNASTNTVSAVGTINASSIQVNGTTIPSGATSNLVFDTVNTAFNVANAAYGSANNVAPQVAPSYNTANAAFNFANGVSTNTTAAFSHSNTTYGAVNSAFGVINAAFGVANAAYGNANNLAVSANAYAGAMANSANAYTAATYVKLTAGQQTITGDLNVTGNLTFLGNSTVVSSGQLTIGDSLIYLAANNYSGTDLVDIGFIANYGNTTAANVHTGLVRDATDKQYYLFQAYDREPANNTFVPGSNNMVNAVLVADLNTSNLTLGGANAIVWIRSNYDTTNAAFGVANGAFGFANGVSTNTTAAFAKANSALANTSGTVFNGTLGISSIALIGNQQTTGTTGTLRLVTTGAGAYIQSGLNTTGSSSSNIIFTNINAGTEWMRITSGGNVGIGTSTANAKLDIGGSPTNTLRLSSSSDSVNYYTEFLNYYNSAKSFEISSGGVSIFRTTSQGQSSIEVGTTGTHWKAGHVGSFLTANTASVERMRIDANGDVGIGTTTPGSKLDVWESALTNTYVTTSSAAAVPDTVSQFSYRGSVANTPVLMSFYDVPSASIWYHGSSGSNVTTSGSFSGSYVIGNRTNTTAFQERVRINANGNVGIGTTIPGANLDMGNANNGWIAVQCATNITSSRGLTWYTPSPTDYGIYRTFGAWSASNYQQLMMRWVTGVIIDGGSGYGLSGTSIQPSGGNVAIGAAASSATEKLYVAGNIKATGYIDSDLAFRGQASDTASIPSFTWTGETYTGMFRPAANTIAFSTGGTERVRIDVSGNVGIGTTSSAGKLTVQRTAGVATGGEIWSTDGTYWTMFNSRQSGGAYSPLVQAGDHAITYSDGTVDTGAFVIGQWSNSSRGLRIAADGNVAIGQATAPERLTVFRDTDNSAEIGRAHVGYVGFADYAGFSHVDQNGTTGYALVQGSTGDTYLNAASGNPIRFRQGNADRMTLDAAGNFGIGTTTPAYKLQVNGSFAANTKSFVIDHPTKPGMKLRYGSLEGPENGVYVRGKINGRVIELPDYWTGLVDEDTITVQLTSIGRSQNLYVVEVSNNQVHIESENYTLPNCYYTIYGERKDVEKLVVEFDV